MAKDDWSKPPKPSNDALFKFGKYSGLYVDAVPNEYLVWCLSNLKFKNPNFKKAIEAEILIRCNGRGPKDDYDPSRKPATAKKNDFNFEDFGPEPNFDPSDDIPF